MKLNINSFLIIFCCSLFIMVSGDLLFWGGAEGRINPSSIKEIGISDIINNRFEYLFYALTFTIVYFYVKNKSDQKNK